MGHGLSCCSAKESLLFKVVDVALLNSPEQNKKANKRDDQLRTQLHSQQLIQHSSLPLDESTLSHQIDGNGNNGKLISQIHQVHSSTELYKLSNHFTNQDNGHCNNVCDCNDNDNDDHDHGEYIPHRPKKNQTEKFDLKKLMPKYRTSTTTVAESTKMSLRPLRSMKYTKEKSIHKPIEIINEMLNDKQINLIKRFLFQGSDLFDQIGESTKNMLINCISYQRICKDHKLFDMETNTEDFLFILEKGAIGMILDDKPFDLTKKTLISTKSIRANAQKSFTLITKKRVYLFKLSYEKYTSICNEFNQRIREEKLDHFKQIYLFSGLEQNTLLKLADVVTRIKYPNRTTLITEAQETVNKMYFIIEGTVICGKGDIIIKKFKQGAIVSELPFFHKTSSMYTYIVEPGSELYEIKYESFSSVIGKQKAMRNIFSNAIMGSDILGKYFSIDNIDSLFKLFRFRYVADDVISSKLHKKVIILLAGLLYKQIPGHSFDSHTSYFDNEIGKKGEIFMDGIVLNDSNFKHEIISDECVVLECQWEDITKSIKCYSKKNTTFYDKISLIRGSPLMSNLSEAKLFRLAESMRTVKFKDKDLIISDGPLSNRLYIIKKGAVSIVVDNMEVKLLEHPRTFGDIAKKPGSYLIKANFVAKGHTECYFIEKETFEDINDYGFLKPFDKMLMRRDISVSLEQLYYIKDLGQGSYGKVYLVHDKNKKYAMKTAEIQAMIQNKTSAQFYLSEKSIMSSLMHPFIVQIYNTYKTREYIFFLLEFVDGMTMREYFEVRPTDKLRNLSEVQFYAAILGTILDYLESKRIIHRDLKPDNLIFDNERYIKAIDFGIAKDLTGKDSTNTIIGTVQYIAPEIALGKRYSFPIDYWAVGIILYEYFYGKVPFGFGLSDPVMIYKEITNIKPILPFAEKNETLNDFIRQLLVQNPSKRIHSFSKFKSHPFFEGFDYEKMLKKELLPPALSVEFKAECEKDIENITYPFHQFMKNHIFCTSAELDLLLKHKKTDDFLSDF